ncbi:FtsK/SpoIIIE domain-containing protein [uncultured Solobacterium sp.]|uniref:FtsK/SpoIIIE domain-containing protein n=1 Tax=uncultured Solobacterium sp. TaxID=747375 RepID=UPI0028E9CEF0|nr:FtsK/SpoIIIE domain-containing protein [uncultured Solobacterium sp.]
MILYAEYKDELCLILVDENRVEHTIFGSHFTLYQKDNSVVIQVIENGISYLLKTEQSCIVQEIQFSVVPLYQGWNQFKSYLYQDTIIIGTVMNDITVSTELLKRNAITINYVTKEIIVDASIHAYINQRRFYKTSFKSGDLLETYYLRIQFEDDFILVNQPANSNCHLSLFNPKQTILSPIKYEEIDTIYQPDLIDEYTLTVEEPEHISHYEKRSVIFSVGPAITMSLASMSGASISMYRGYMNGRDIVDMLPMILLPSMMLLSTILWNPLQQLHEKKDNQKKVQLRNKEYKTYLEQLKMKVDKIHQIYTVYTKKLVANHTQLQKQLYPKYIYLPVGQTKGAIKYVFEQPFQFQKNDAEFQECLNDIVVYANTLDAPYILKLQSGCHIVLQYLDEYLFCILRYLSTAYRHQDVLIACLIQTKDDVSYSWLKKIPHMYHNGSRCISSSIQELNIKTQNFNGIKVLFNFSNQYLSELKEWITFDTVEHYNATHILMKEGDAIIVRNHEKKTFHQCYKYNDLINADVKHQISTKQNSITNNHSFFSIYDVDTIEDLNIYDRWSTSDISKSMQIRLGKDVYNQPIYFDLHECKDGPHGLIAGTTGSGKSELITTLLLSLAISFSPNDLQIVLIDFKGGGAGSVLCLKDHQLPHVCGNLSNLDIDDMKRSLHALKNICSYREKLFKEVSNTYGSPIINLNAYRKAITSNTEYPSLAELVIVVDEFAELKRERPEFLEELIVIARVGRSLGIHLILATQKPAGVVNDQIWANTNFRICMRVADRQDSMEVLHDAKAAFLQKPGEFYLCNSGGIQYGIAGYAHAKKAPLRHIEILDQQGNVEVSSSLKQIQPAQITQVLNTIRMLYPSNVKQLWLSPLSLYSIPCDTEFSIGYIDDYYLFTQPKLLLNFKINHSYLFVGKSYQERDNIAKLLLYRLQQRNQTVFIIDDLFFKNNSNLNLFHNDNQEVLCDLFSNLKRNQNLYLFITDLTLFLQNDINREYLMNLLEMNQKYNIRLLLLNQSVVTIPYRILTLISCKVSLSNDNVQEIQALFSTTEKCIQKKRGYGLVMLHQNLLECSFFQMGDIHES